MRLSIDVYQLRKRFGEEQAFSMIKDAGFHCVDYSFYWLNPEEKQAILGDGYREYAQKVKEQLNQMGLICNQAHAPFDFKLINGEISLSNLHYCEVVRSIEAASIMGAEQIVVHPLTPADDRSVLDVNVDYYKSLEPYCEKFGIRIAVENLPCPRYDNLEAGIIGHKFGRAEDIYALIKKLNSPWFVCCIDVGHAAITGIAPEKLIGDLDNSLLQALHIHDNDCQSDLHLLPYLGKLDWDNIAQSLADIQYQGDLTFEVFGFMKKFDDDMMESALDIVASAGRNLDEKIKHSK